MKYEFNKDSVKGPLLTVASAVFLTFGFISIKYFLNFTNPVTLNLLWMGSALIVAIIIAKVRRIKWIPIIKRYWSIGIAFGSLIGIGSILMVYAINSIGPSLSSFLVRFVMVFTVILGIVLLKERLSKIELLGMIIAVIGVFTLSYVSGGVVQLGSIFVITASLLFAINGVMTKMYSVRINPLEMIILRDTFAVATVFLYSIVSGDLQPVSFNLVGMIFLASILSVVGFLSFLRALQLMDLTKVMIIRSLDPFLVVAYSFIFFRDIPSLMQMVGGSLIVLGVMATVAKHHIKRTADAIKVYGQLKFIGR